MKCKHCNNEIVLVPSAAERAKKDVTGKTAQDYTNLFCYHAACTLELRNQKPALLNPAVRHLAHYPTRRQA